MSEDKKTVAELLREYGGRGYVTPCYLCHEMYGDGCCPDHRCRDASATSPTAWTPRSPRPAA